MMVQQTHHEIEQKIREKLKDICNTDCTHEMCDDCHWLKYAASQILAALQTDSSTSSPQDSSASLTIKGKLVECIFATKLPNDAKLYCTAFPGCVDTHCDDCVVKKQQLAQLTADCLRMVELPSEDELADMLRISDGYVSYLEDAKTLLRLLRKEGK